MLILFYFHINFVKHYIEFLPPRPILLILQTLYEKMFVVFVRKNTLCLCLSCTRLISHRAVEVKSSHAIRLRPVLTRVLMPNVN